MEKVSQKSFDLRKSVAVYATITGVVNMLCLGIVCALFRTPGSMINNSFFNISFSYKYFLLCCLISSSIPLIYILFQRSYANEVGTLNWNTDLMPGIFLVFVSCFMLFVYEPLLMYLTNPLDFWFDFQMMLPQVLKSFFLFFGLCIAALFFSYVTIAKILKKRFIYKTITIFAFCLFFLLYIQGNWLSKNLPKLNGEEIVWLNYGRVENLLMFIILSFLLFIITFGVCKFGFEKTIRFEIFGSVLIFLMLLSALIATFIISKDTSKETIYGKQIFTPSWANFNKISTEKNFLVFLVDSVDETTFLEVLNDEKYFQNTFDDFTHYTNAMSVYPHTKHSIPQILTGSTFKNDESFAIYCNDAYNNSPLFKKINSKQYDINLYSLSIYWEGNEKYDIKNQINLKDTSISFIPFLEQEIKYIFFKYMPYNLKPFSRIEEMDYEQCKTISSSDVKPYSMENIAVYNTIKENPVLEKHNSNYFSFVHIEGSHSPANMDKNMNYISDGTYSQKTGAALTVIKTYLQRLKANNCYDNSVIIIMADHGRGENTFRFNPILLIKGRNEKHDMISSDLPVSYNDLQDAFSNLLDGKSSQELFLDIEDNRKRTVLNYWPWTEENHIVEYETYGKNSEGDRFVPTGNIYDK